MAGKIIWWKIAEFILAILSIILFDVLRSTNVIDWSWGWIFLPVVIDDIFTLWCLYVLYTR